MRRGEVRTHPPNEWVWAFVEVGARLAAAIGFERRPDQRPFWSYLGVIACRETSAIVILRDAV